MARSSDRSLLDRLNALKPTSVNLDRSTNALSIPAAAGIQPAEPLSREDALSERLRSLRNTRDARDDHIASESDPPPPYTASSPSTRTQPPPPSSARDTASASHGDGAGSRRSGGGGEVAEGGSQSSGEYDDYFDDVLQPLDLDDEEDGLGSDGGGGEGSSKRVVDLLARLKADPGAQPPPPAESKPDGKDDSDDDSEGEVMSREVENVISRALDELNLDGPASQPAGSDAVVSPGGEPKAEGHGRAAAPGGDDHELALPLVPQDAAENQERGGSGDGDGEAGLSLPAVPTELVDPAPTLRP